MPDASEDASRNVRGRLPTIASQAGSTWQRALIMANERIGARASET